MDLRKTQCNSPEDLENRLTPETKLGWGLSALTTWDALKESFEDLDMA